MNSRRSCLEELFQILVQQVALFNQYLVHLHGDFQTKKRVHQEPCQLHHEEEEEELCAHR